jgi:CheY-like chemotaxis protein
MADGGVLRIETSNCAVGPHASADLPTRPGDYVRLRVMDTGEGIPPEVRSRIFEPFFTTKDAGRGTGLGLSTVYGIVQQSEGFIFLDTEVNRGTTFSIFLPRTMEVAVVEAPAVAAAPAMQEATILLVEDEASVRDLAARVLSGAGYQVLSAPGPQAALRTAANFPETIHLLLTDVVMPDMSGPLLAERLRTLRPTVEVLFISGFSGQSVTAIEPFGEQRLLPKPFTPASLVARVRDVLSQVQS